MDAAEAVRLEQGVELTEGADVLEGGGVAEADEGAVGLGFEVVDVVGVDGAAVAVGEVEEDEGEGAVHSGRVQDVDLCHEGLV